jgi:DNA invertase Pin-like site-specific DNA recombinase
VPWDILANILLARFRSAKDVYGGQVCLEQHKLESINSTQTVDTDITAGNLLWGVLVAAAQFEREQISGRIQRSIAGARAQSKRLSRPAVSMGGENRSRRDQGPRSAKLAKA